jgi:high-affinity iron transporter
MKSWLVVSLSLLACTKPEHRGGDGTAPPEAFVARCSACHGPRGHGDGVAASGFNPRPPDFRDARWQKQASDGELRDVILHGGPARGRSAVMPANPGLSPSEVDAIVAFIRGESGAP